jgi:hypothetical protein
MRWIQKLEAAFRSGLGFGAFYRRRYKGAVRHLERVEQLEPGHHETRRILEEARRLVSESKSSRKNEG